MRQHLLPILFSFLLFVAPVTFLQAVEQPGNTDPCGVTEYVEANLETAAPYSYRLFNDHFLDVGNTWNYKLHVTMMDNSTVNLWSDATQRVSGTAIVNGVNTRVVEDNDNILGLEKNYYTLGSDFIRWYKTENSNITGTFTSANPLEDYPISISNVDSNKHIGNANFGCIQNDPWYNWTCTFDTYVTFLRQESISVTAGTFQCTVILNQQIRIDDDGYQVTTEETDWIDPHIGIIKASLTENTWDGESNWITSGIYELTSTNIQPQAFCTSPLTFDYNNDCKINFKDFATAVRSITLSQLSQFARSWLVCNLDPVSACY